MSHSQVLHEIEYRAKQICRLIDPYISGYFTYINTPKSNNVFNHSISSDCGIIIQFRCDYNEFKPSNIHIKMAYTDKIEGLKVIEFEDTSITKISNFIINIIQNDLLY